MGSILLELLFVQVQHTRWSKKDSHSSTFSWMIVLLGFICLVHTHIMSSEDKNLHVLEQKAPPSFPAPAPIELMCIKAFRYQKFKSTHCTVAVCAELLNEVIQLDTDTFLYPS